MVVSEKSNIRTLVLLFVSFVLLLIFAVALGVAGFLISTSVQKSLSQTSLDSADISTKCLNEGGNWINSTRECEKVSEPFCRSAGGTYDACASPCRNASGEVMCVQMCVQVCTFK